VRCVASNYFTAAATIAADAAAATVAYQKHSGSNKRHVFVKKYTYNTELHADHTNITVVIIVFSTSRAYDIAQSRDSNTVQRYSPRSNSLSLRFFLPFSSV